MQKYKREYRNRTAKNKNTNINTKIQKGIQKYKNGIQE